MAQLWTRGPDRRKLGHCGCAPVHSWLSFCLPEVIGEQVSNILFGYNTLCYCKPKTIRLSYLKLVQLELCKPAFLPMKLIISGILLQQKIKTDYSIIINMKLTNPYLKIKIAQPLGDIHCEVMGQIPLWREEKGWKFGEETIKDHLNSKYCIMIGIHSKSFSKSYWHFAAEDAMSRVITGSVTVHCYKALKIFSSWAEQRDSWGKAWGSLN